MEQQDVADQDLRTRLEQLPTLPAIVMRLMSLNRSDDRYFEQVHELLKEDPPLAVRMLHIANSALQAPVSPITTLPGTLARLGANRIAELVTSAAVTRVFVPTTSGQRKLWIHSVQVASAARWIAASSRDAMVDPEEAYLAGLLHDIGRFLMFEDDPQEFVDIETFGWASRDEMLCAERSMCGWDHAELGRRICDAWTLPPRLASIIREHHALELHRNHAIAPDERRVIQSVQMADHLSMLMLSHDKLVHQTDAERLRRIERCCVCPSWDQPPISPARLAALLDAIDDESRAMADGLGLGG